jgi:hypothetical protein
MVWGSGGKRDAHSHANRAHSIICHFANRRIYIDVWTEGLDLARKEGKAVSAGAGLNAYHSSSFLVCLIASNNIEFPFEYEKLRLRAAGVKPNSPAIRSIISAWRFAIAT